MLSLAALSKKLDISETFIKSLCVAGRLQAYTSFCKGEWYLDPAGIKILKEIIQHTDSRRLKIHAA